MNKAFTAICFWQSLPDLPPLGRHVPLTAFYRLVKAELNMRNETFMLIYRSNRTRIRAGMYG